MLTQFLTPLTRLLDGWLPRHCALCERRLRSQPRSDPAGLGLCPPCLQALPGRQVRRCLHCAQRLPPQVDPAPTTCESCNASGSIPRALDSVHAACDYAPPLDRWITAMKYGGEPSLAAPLGALLIPQALALASCSELIIAVPPAARRLVERGFDHTAHIATPVARALGRRLQSGLLRRTRHTPEQAGLSRHARGTNLQGAFEACARVARRSVLLVDDVMTTRATLDEAARALRARGAGAITGLVIARPH